MRSTARARMLHRSISLSERINRLTLKAALLYTWMVPHADDQGRLSGTASTLKATVCPLRRDIPEIEIPGLLYEMVEPDLIFLYDQDEEDHEDGEEVRRVVQIVDWWEYQKLKDPQPSRFEPHEDWDQDRASHPRDEFGKYR